MIFFISYYIFKRVFVKFGYIEYFFNEINVKKVLYCIIVNVKEMYELYI